MALCLLTLEVQTLKSVELFEILLRVQKHSKVNIFCGLSLQLLGLVQLVLYNGSFKGPLLSVSSLYRHCWALAEMSNEWVFKHLPATLATNIASLVECQMQKTHCLEHEVR